jgi:predicted amidohydrolase
MAEVTLAAANVRIAHHDKTANLRRFLELIDEAGAAGADILVLPEMGLQGYADFAFGIDDRGIAEQKQYYFRAAEPIPGPATSAIAERAAKYGMIVQLGLAESALDGNLIFNSTALISPDGVIGVYRKVHNQAEAIFFGAGEQTPVFDTPVARVASLICYDLAFPELMRVFALRGATVALMSTAWPMKGNDPSADYYGTSMNLCAQANAFFNRMWLVVSNHCETGAYSAGIDYWGNSQIVDPHGNVVSAAGQEEGLVLHTADLADEVLRSRTESFFGLNLLADRRPQHYGAVSDRACYVREAQPPTRPAGRNEAG